MPVPPAPAQGVPVIVLCPCCAAAIDAVAQEGEPMQNLECPTCGQQWAMQLDVARLDQFAR